MSEITNLSAANLSRLIKTRALSCVELMGAACDQIDRLNPALNAIVNGLSKNQCLALARDADAALSRGKYRGWLHGIPIAVKDLSHAAGFPTTYGSKLFSNHIANSDDPHVARIRDAGAIVLGKTNVPEWGLGGHTDNSVFGLTRNARDTRLSAGGSSGGAATALASNMLPLADGSDMMGSLRTPAAFQGVVGFRPTPGAIPIAHDMDPLKLGLVSIGPMARSVEDIDLLFSIMSTQSSASQPKYALDRLSGLKIGWLSNADGAWHTEPGVLSDCENVLKQLDGAGCLTVPCFLQLGTERLWTCWTRLRQLALSTTKKLYDDPAKRSQMGPTWQWEITQGSALTKEEIADAYRIRQEWLAALDQLFSQFDVLAAPACQVYPFPAEPGPPMHVENISLDTYHRWLEVSIPASLGGLPTICLPVSVDPQRAAGMQLIMRSGRDRALLDIAAAIEHLTPK